ncbi:MAG: cytochrome C oxidase subunit IV family protein [Candidatus Promineifilaceae bacterium]
MRDKAATYRQGVIVFAALAALTLIEFFISQSLQGAVIPLTLVALVKAGLIVQYFMHIYRLWREEEHE